MPTTRRQTARAEILRRTILQNKYIPHKPTARQAEFLMYQGREAMYGGSAAGGKSDALLSAALQYVDIPGYAAILFRRTFADLAMPGALMDRANQWLYGHDVHRGNKGKVWTFPSGATLSFGYLDHEDTKFRYASAEFQFVGFDELTQFEETQYTFLFSRLRRLETSKIPIRMRSASNPGGRGHEWVKRRFIVPDGQRFFPAKLADNPHVDAKEYVKSLDKLDPITKAQLLQGDWQAFAGGRFDQSWWGEMEVGIDDHGDEAYYLWHMVNGQMRPDGPERGHKVAHCWNFIVCDPAASEGDQADFTAIGVFAVTPDRDLLVLHMVRERINIDQIVPRIASLCLDYAPLWVGIEDVGFQVAILNAAKRHKDIPAVRGLSPEGKGKLVRATPAIIRTYEGQVFTPPRGPRFPWVADFIAECIQFTGDEEQDAHDDQVDVLAYAVQALDRFGLGGPAIVESDSRHEAETELFDVTADEREEGMGWRAA